jgi:hypothetical protein
MPESSITTGKNYHADTPDYFHLAQLPKYDDFFADPVRKKELEEFQAKQRERSRIAETYRGLTESVEGKSSALATLKDKVAFYANCDVPNSLYQAFLTQSHPIEFLADSMLRPMIFKEHGAALIKLATADLAAQQKSLEVFRSENEATLKELELI